MAKPMLKSEKLVFEDKNFLVFISFPMKYSTNTRLEKIRKKYKSYPITFTFNKDLKRSFLYHSFFDPTSYVTGAWSASLIELNQVMSKMFVEINEVFGNPKKYKTGTQDKKTHL